MSPGSPSNDPLHALLHTLWSKAVGTKHYVKKEWCKLQQAIWSLQGLTPTPLDSLAEPMPYDPDSNGNPHPADADPQGDTEVEMPPYLFGHQDDATAPLDPPTPPRPKRRPRPRRKPRRRPPPDRP